MKIHFSSYCLSLLASVVYPLISRPSSPQSSVVCRLSSIVCFSMVLMLPLASYSATDGPATTQQFTIQVEACRNRAYAEETVERLKKKGYAPYVYETTGFGNQNWYVVRLGDYGEIEEASEALSMFKSKENRPAVITWKNSLSPVTTSDLQRLKNSDVKTPTAADKNGHRTFPKPKGIQLAASETPVVKSDAQPSYALLKAAFTVQLVPYPDKKGAEEMSESLLKDGYNAYVFEGKDSKARTWYAVRIGDFDTREKADAALLGFKRAKRMPAFVTPVDSLTPSVSAVRITAAAAHGEKSQEEIAKALIERAPVSEERGTASALSQPEGPMDLAQLRDQLRILQTDFQQMREQNEIRKKLELSQEEKSEKEEEILFTAGRQYLLLKKGTLDLEYDFKYQYYSSDILANTNYGLDVRPRSNHTITNSIYSEYALLDYLTFDFNIPFVYAYDQVGTDNEKDVTDLGDISVGFEFQPIKAGGKYPAPIVFTSFTMPTGRSPYDINPNTELSTGNGYYAATAGFSLSKAVDPIVAFGNVAYTYTFDVDDIDQNRNGKVLTEVDPGDIISGAIGLGYALSYKATLNMSYQYSYYFESDFRWKDGTTYSSGSYVSSIFNIGAGWRLSPKFSVTTKIGIGLTNNDPDVTFSVRLPFLFDLGSE